MNGKHPEQDVAAAVKVFHVEQLQVPRLDAQGGVVIEACRVSPRREEVSGCAPDSALTFLCFAKEK